MGYFGEYNPLFLTSWPGHPSTTDPMDFGFSKMMRCWTPKSNRCGFWMPRFGCFHVFLGGVFKYILFSPLLGEDSHFDDHIFQMGWNHQLVCLCRNFGEFFFSRSSKVQTSKQLPKKSAYFSKVESFGILRGLGILLNTYFQVSGGFLKKIYQHRPQIAKTNFCVINVENLVTSARSSCCFLFWVKLVALNKEGGYETGIGTLQ